MVGSGLRKLANENGMKIAKGVAYGSLRGYGATLSEGAGWKRIAFATSFPDPVQKTRFMDEVGAVDVQKQFRVQSLGITPKVIQVTFLDNPGTMKKIYGFLDWFLPLLRQYGATGADICSECGFPVTAGKWVMIGGNAHCLHDSCVQKLKREMDAENQQRREADKGSYLTGALGAFGGALLGSLVWALVLMMGYVASLVGLLIGWLSEKGYTLLKGRQGKGKVWILIGAIVFGVCAGTLLSDVLMLAKLIGSGDMPGFVMSDIPLLMTWVLADPEYLLGTGGNILMGLMFAALGVFSMLRKTGKDVAERECVELN